MTNTRSWSPLARIVARCKGPPPSRSRHSAVERLRFALEFTHCVTQSIDQRCRVCEPSRVAKRATRTTSVAKRGVVATSIAVAVCLACADVRAGDVDGVYGRLRADTALSLEAGGGIATVSESTGVGNGSQMLWRPMFVATARARYLDMSGLFLAYQVAFGGARYDALALGVDLRPLMMARIAQDWEQGPRWADLTLDSIGLELGVAWVRPGASWQSGSGLALVFGAGVDLPLVWGHGNGLMLRVGCRWIHSTESDAQGPGAGVNSGESVMLTLNLVGRTMARLGFVGGH